MAKKQFRTESKKLLDMMINSIYTHKEIFLRELISNASDAIDKLYFRSLTDDSISLKHSDYEIRLCIDKDARILSITDNGIGMTKDELENNLGTIARSGSLDFKKDEGSANENIDIIGQFGVGFYSAFMVSDKITVESKAYGSDEAWRWYSSGVDAYYIEECEKATVGTVITLHIKEDTEDETYGEYLDEYRIRDLVKRYSDYIRYPIKMLTEHRHLKEGTKDKYETHTDDETLNSMVPLWKREQKDVTDEEYYNFYRDKFFDYEEPLKVIRQKAEGTTEYLALLFIPGHAPYDFYTRDYEKGLQLYSSGVMIMDKCADLLPDYFSFVKGLVDSSDLTLNISRETLQHDRQLKTIAKALEKKISSELNKMLENEREKYETFFKEFGRQLKFGVYSDYGMHKDTLQDLLMFHSSNGDKPVTLKEYIDRMPEDKKKIYYAAGETAERIAMLPQVEAVLSHGYEVLYLTEDVDEFALQVMHSYSEKEFSNVCTENPELESDDEKETIKKENEENKDLLDFMKESIGERVSSVKFTGSLKNHPACLSSAGALSLEMEKTMSKMPGADDSVKAQLVLEINANHEISAKLKGLYLSDKVTLAKYSKILFANAGIISGLTPENPSELSELVCDLMLH